MNKITTVLKHEEFMQCIQDIEECRKQQEEQRQLERNSFAEKFNEWITEHEKNKSIQE